MDQHVAATTTRRAFIQSGSLAIASAAAGCAPAVVRSDTGEAPARRDADVLAQRPEGAQPGPGTIVTPVIGVPPKDLAMYGVSMDRNEPYMLGRDSKVQDGVPRGTITQFHHRSARVYPGVERDYWLYVPVQYDATRPACLMVFWDGRIYLSGDLRAPAIAGNRSNQNDVNPAVVFDNLIHRREMPVTLGLFVEPGDPGPGIPTYGSLGGLSGNRSFEYDSLTGRYARFVLEELIPEVQKRYRIVDDPAGRATCGFSSGGIGAFTAAWERPDAFGKVVSHCGSFMDIRGGHNYPSMIRKREKKPIRVFLQTGTKDYDGIFGSILLANREMAAALAYRDYDYQLVVGEGGHTLMHGGAIFPDSVRWLWRDYPKAG